MLDTIHKDGRVQARLITVDKPPGLDQAIAEVIGNWRDVYRLPLDTLKAFGYTKDDKRSGLGFEVKLDAAGKSDRKLDMHLTIERQAEQLAQADKVDGTGSFRRFILSIEHANNVAAPAIIRYAQGIERAERLTGFADRVASAKHTWMWRPLWYPPGTVPPGKILAELHTDKGGFTPHFHECGGYMEYLETAEPVVWKRMETRADGIPILPGIGLQEHSQCTVTAAVHQVVADEESFANGREALVCFVDFVGMRSFDKNTHGSQQGMPFAYNYAYGPSRHAKFSKKYFVD